jgi:ubiquinone/menaquinone biosynthesis C-methylase UbiE
VASTSYERISGRYERERGGQGRATVIAEALLPWLNRGETVLDVGVGTGIVAGTLAASGVPVLGVDLSMGMLTQARDRLPGAVTQSDAQALPFSNGSFVAVIFVWSLHHVGGPIIALREARRVVRHGGRVIVASATPDNTPDDVQARFRELDVLSPPRPVDWIEQAAESAGLRHTATGQIRIEVARSPLELVEQIQDRLYSPLWDLDDRRWNRVVVPIMDELRGLDEPDRQRKSTLCSPVLVFAAKDEDS